MTIKTKNIKLEPCSVGWIYLRKSMFNDEMDTLPRTHIYTHVEDGTNFAVGIENNNGGLKVYIKVFERFNLTVNQLGRTGLMCSISQCIMTW